MVPGEEPPLEWKQVLNHPLRRESLEPLNEDKFAGNLELGQCLGVTPARIACHARILRENNLVIIAKTHGERATRNALYTQVILDGRLGDEIEQWLKDCKPGDELLMND